MGTASGFGPSLNRSFLVARRTSSPSPRFCWRRSTLTLIYSGKAPGVHHKDRHCGTVWCWSRCREEQDTEEGQGGKESDGEFPVQRRRDNGIVSFLYPQHSGSVTRLPWRRSVRDSRRLRWPHRWKDIDNTAIAMRYDTPQRDRHGGYFCCLFRLSHLDHEIFGLGLHQRGLGLCRALTLMAFTTWKLWEAPHDSSCNQRNGHSCVSIARLAPLAAATAYFLPLLPRLLLPTQPLLLPLLFLHKRHGGATFSLPSPPLVLICPTSNSGSLCIKIVTPLSARNM